ncbi:MAG: glycosyltransferase family 4 protein [Chitinophagales bacterium]|nr:glycosyltransferase family 4 protein [Chitinophagales bacterium]
MKKIGIIANTSWNILNFRLGLIEALKSNHYQVVIMAPEDEHSITLKEMGYDIQFVKRLSRKGTNPFADFLLAIELTLLYRKLHLDFVLQYTIKPNIYGSIAGLLAGKKVISTVTGLGYVFLNKSIGSKIAKLLYRIALRFSYMVFFQNSDDKALFEETGLVPKSKSRLVNGSGIDIHYFHPDFCKGFQKDADKTNFLMIGRLLKDKGVYEFISACKMLREKYPNTEFTVLGDYDEGNPTAVDPDDIKKWQDENIVQLPGFKKNTRDYICKADVVVLPSYREGIPRVILESFAMGKPSITTNVPGCKHVVDDNVNGLLCNVKDEIDLFKKMEGFVLLSASKKKEMGENARKKAENVYATEQIVKVYLSIIEGQNKS